MEVTVKISVDDYLQDACSRVWGTPFQKEDLVGVLSDELRDRFDSMLNEAINVEIQQQTGDEPRWMDYADKHCTIEEL